MGTTKKEATTIQDFIKNLPPIERRPDGSLPRMTPGQRRKAHALIRKVCCNYVDGNCLLLDDGEECACVQSISLSVNCKYFRHVVLEDRQCLALKAELFHDEAAKRCAVCGKAFRSQSNNAKYCPACAKDVQRKQKAAHARKRREDVEK